MTVAALVGLLGGYGLVRLLRAALGEPIPSPLPRSVRLREVAVRGGAALAAAAVAAGLTTSVGGASGNGAYGPSPAAGSVAHHDDTLLHTYFSQW